MSKHAKNKFKKLPEQIGKGIDVIHTQKVLDARSKLIGIQVTELKKAQFKMACEVLELKQTDILEMAIDETIKKALK